QLRKLYTEKRGKAIGLFTLLKKRAGVDSHAELALAYEEMVKMHKELSLELSEFLFEMQDVLGKWTKESNTIGIDEDFLNDPDYQTLSGALAGLFKRINQFTVQFEMLSL